MTHSQSERRRMAVLLSAKGVLTSPWLRAAVETVPREQFLHPGVFIDEGRAWRPVTALGTEPDEWLKIAYSVDTLTTQLDGRLTADQVVEPLAGVPTSSSTDPTTVIGMIEALDLEAGHRVLEIGTGTGYSTALMCHFLGEDNVTTIEVDPQVAARADSALEGVGYSTWTVTGDGLLGHPRRAPYDRTIATCAVRRIPYAWVRQTKPGGIILSTVGSWPWGTGLAKVTVGDDGTAEGTITGRSSFMQARAQAVTPVAGDLSARTAYADSKREAKVSPLLLEEWMPAFLAQLAAPGAQLVRASTSNGARLLYLFDPARESFAEFAAGDEGGVVRQGGPVALWDNVERSLIAWQEAGSPDIATVQLRITDRAHTYWIGDHPDLRWEHRLDVSH
ncbi:MULTISPECIES: ATP-grasp peptide maturase system methyltransferase [Streptomyces]|uniref:ATP-grasp peptide maturase system methyltransferase n=1 Tax=Streptomyces TaxID=1883 RepID=UPI0022720CA2|nr:MULTISPECIES: ATP-grasp peptide maturase system methyltransferase [unclassified Streptomyces]MCY0923298.1 ATP-grasp peptide maturase system methyltransferase [Streptomyces sp. H27-G5]MCY0943959.1 ATP-grasp peptide maturase system methyltransferase [Streptomyces sp. H34-AA3]MCY0956321.1 ATP-grasp peptide maturase system methyltransferase [Streptomyces sp. H27-H5]MCZ4082341.1 ATP-grasp peptide maturase system methyltransferase [Streptomyces sp. H34-S5]